MMSFVLEFGRLLNGMREDGWVEWCGVGGY